MAATMGIPAKVRRATPPPPRRGSLASASRTGRNGRTPTRADRAAATTKTSPNGNARRVSRPAGQSQPVNHTTHAVSPSSNGSSGNYGKALRFLATLSDYERLRIVRYNPQNFDLDRMRTLLRKLGNPHDQFKSVHVAGTKGKGSTCAMIAAMVQANGHKVGLYTSPHLTDIRERIQINGEMISQADFARLVRLIEPIVMKSRPTPTYFDVLTAVAFKYFAEQKVDLAVIETGL